MEIGDIVRYGRCNFLVTGLNNEGYLITHTYKRGNQLTLTRKETDVILIASVRKVLFEKKKK